MEKTREIKNRINSITGTRKITKAMGMIASSRIKKAQDRIFEARPYISKIVDTITDISCYSNISHPLLAPHDEIKKVLILGVTADRGLCGGYNSNIIKIIEKNIRRVKEKGQEFILDIIGTRGKNYFNYMGYELNEVYENLSDYPKFLDAREIARKIISLYSSHEIDKVIFCYTRFKNPAEQLPSTFIMLPVPFSSESEDLKDPDTDTGMVSIGDTMCRISPEFTYDPSPREVVQSLLKSYIYTTIYTVLLESTASEIGARMTAMKSASENAEEMIRDLERKYHRARQQQITMELTEIVSGTEALANDR